MEIDDLSLDFFDQGLTHNDIGYILQRNEKEEVETSAMFKLQYYKFIVNFTNYKITKVNIFEVIVSRLKTKTGH